MCVFLVASWGPHTPTVARLPGCGVAVSSLLWLCGWESWAGGLPSQPCSQVLGGQVGWSQAERPRGQLPERLLAVGWAGTASAAASLLRSL